MIRKGILFVILSVFVFSCKPYEAPTEFSQEALNAIFQSLDDNEVTFDAILEKHKGRTILIDVWASWCGDCLKTLRQLKEVQAKNNDVVYVFLSADRSYSSWKRSIIKYDIKGEHYFIPKGMKSDFGKAIGLDWIPRYMVIGPDSKIKHFKAINVSDIHLLKALN